MFDIGMGELGLIAVVGLLVLGPERLPRVARTAGVLVRKARQSWQSVRSDIERELAAEDLKRTLRETAAAADPGPELRRAAAPPQSPASVESMPGHTPRAEDSPGPASPPPGAPDTHDER